MHFILVLVIFYVIATAGTNLGTSQGSKESRDYMGRVTSKILMLITAIFALPGFLNTLDAIYKMIF